jgi:hypothetical protein
MNAHLGEILQSGSETFGSDPDPRIRTYDKRIRIQFILLFSSLTFRKATKNNF